MMRAQAMQAPEPDGPVPDEGDQAQAEQGLRQEYDEWLAEQDAQAEYQSWLDGR